MVETYVKVVGEEQTTYVEVLENDPVATPKAIASVLVRPTIRNSDFQRGIQNLFGDKR
jgi:hypothetical protein